MQIENISKSEKLEYAPNQNYKPPKRKNLKSTKPSYPKNDVEPKVRRQKKLNAWIYCHRKEREQNCAGKGAVVRRKETLIAPPTVEAT
jgi:hypothetical protein